MDGLLETFPQAQRLLGIRPREHVGGARGIGLQRLRVHRTPGSRIEAVVYAYEAGLVRPGGRKLTVPPRHETQPGEDCHLARLTLSYFLKADAFNLTTWPASRMPKKDAVLHAGA